MPTDQCKPLVTELQTRQLLSAAQAAELNAPQAPFADAEALAGELVRRGWLTAYQAGAVLGGRAEDLILGPYVLLDLLGQGGMGLVLKAELLGEIVVELAFAGHLHRFHGHRENRRFALQISGRIICRERHIEVALVADLRAARVTDHAAINLPHSLREKIASKLEKSGLAPLKVERVRRFVPVERADRAGLFGESLPPGLVLG